MNPKDVGNDKSPLALSSGVAKVRSIKETRSYSLKMVWNRQSLRDWFKL
jgi:hypothetical protein